MLEIGAIDCNSLLARVAAPVFVLDERGTLVFANDALWHWLGARPESGDAALSALLAMPLDLPSGQVRYALRLWTSGAHKRWLCLWFLPLDSPQAGRVGVLGYVTDQQLNDVPVKASDAIAHERLARLGEQQLTHFGFETLPATGPAMSRVLRQVQLAINTKHPTLLLGESGVGKTYLARLIHEHGSNPGATFETLNCIDVSAGAQRQQLLGRWTELEKPGAAGLLNARGPGTLLIRGVTHLALDLQSEIARRFSGDAEGWRLIATERAPIEPALGDGRLLESLYQLLTTVVIAVPPLRQRRDDLADCCAWFLEACGDEPHATGFDDEALRLLLAYDWPGNVRELDSVLRACARNAAGRLIGPDDLPTRIRTPGMADGDIAPSILPPLDEALDALQRDLVRQALQRFRGNKSKAAEALRISRPRMLRLVEQLGSIGCSNDPPAISGEVRHVNEVP